MAIVKMKRLTLLAIREDKGVLFRAMQKMQCVEMTELHMDGAAREEREAPARPPLESIRRALNKLARWDDRPKPMFGMLPQVSPEKAKDVLARERELMGVVKRLDEIEKLSGEARGREARILSAREQYLPWAELEVSQKDLESAPHVFQTVGSVPTRALPTLEEALGALPAALKAVSRVQDMSNVYVAIHNSALDEGRRALDAAQFSQESFSSLGGLTPKAFLSRLDEDEKALNREREELAAETKSLAVNIPDLQTLHDLYQLEEERAAAAEKSVDTRCTFLMQGWVPAERAEKLEKTLRRLSPSCSIEFEDPKEDEEPGVLLKNSRFASAFEPVVEGFSLPNYRGFDPTAVMAPFYVCLFGMMVSDAGYGLMMALALWAFVKIKKIPLKNAKMLYLLIFGGLSTVVWGLVFNTVVGFNPLPRLGRFFPLDPVNDPMPVIAVCLAMGAIHLFAGLGVAAYMNLRKGDWVGALSDQASWALLLVGLGLMLVPSLKTAGQYMALAGCLIILVMTGRGKKNPIARLMSGLGALYGVTGWISDLLSYMRLFGMGLATGVIGMVFNILIGMVWSGGIIGKVLAVALFILCHLFNLGINALGAYVHSCRLQYIEFFGKFYEDGGKPFRPMDMKTRYVSLETPGE